MTRDEVLSELKCAIEMVESRLKYSKAKLIYCKKYDIPEYILNKMNIENVKEQIEVDNALLHTLNVSKDLIERKVVR